MLPPLLEDSEIEYILSRADELVVWASDIKEYSLQQAISGKEWDGWKLVEGRSRFDELLTSYIEKPQGKPTLVPESDKRPAINNAKIDFMEEI